MADNGPTDRAREDERSSFERVLDDFKKDLTDNDVKDYQVTTLSDLKMHIAAIQARQKRMKTMQNMTRLRGFLNAIETYSTVADGFVNIHNFVAFIWGPMKFLLLTASAYAEAFNGLLDTYKSIGENLPLLEQYRSLFGKDTRVRCVLERIFTDIFEFHRQALRYFRKPAWKQIFHATWSTFKTSIGPLVENLKQHQKLLVDQAGLEHFHRAEKHRVAATQRFEEQQDWEKEQRRIHLLSWLSVGDVHKYQDQGAKTREGNASSGRWILDKEAFRTWYETYTVEPLLWIHGKPGIGKTVLASLIVEEAKKLRGTTVVSFYCRHNDPERNTFVAMARALVWQLLVLDEALIAPLFLTSTKSGEPTLKTQKVAAEVLDLALQMSGKTCIIVDGLDECSETEQKHIAKWLRKYVDKSGFGFQACKCLFLSQHDGITKSLLSKLPTLHLSPRDNRTDLESYCKHWAAGLERFELETSSTNKLALDIVDYSDGMFLYAKLMMDHFSFQTNLHDLQAEMNYSALPSDLEEMYDRILDRVLDPKNPPRRRDALQLLQWLVCAKRPLTWEEIQTAICIDSNKEDVNLDRRRVVDAQHICGALIEIGRRGEIELIHNTARAYLMNKHVDAAKSHLTLSSLCLEYFSFPMFDTDISTEDVDEHLCKGGYGFFEYAIVHWASHMELATRNDQLSAHSLEKLTHIIDEFMELHWQPPLEKVTTPKHALETVRLLQNSDERLLKTLASMHRLTTTGVSDISKYATLDLFECLGKVRERMEHLAANGDGDDQTSLERYYGSYLFKCSRLYCKWFHQGFKDATKRQTHLEKHERPFHCLKPGCHVATIGCATKKDLDAHVASYHEEEDAYPSYVPEPTSKSPDQQSEQENIADREENATDKPQQPAESTTQPKERPQLIRREPRKRVKTTHQCDQCSRIFTRRYNLEQHQVERHSSGHVRKKYQCEECGKGFHRKADRKRHDKVHTNFRLKNQRWSNQDQQDASQPRVGMNNEEFWNTWDPRGNP